MKTKKSIVTRSGKVVPAGTDLQFANGTADFNGEQIDLASIPYEACEYAMNETLHPAVFDDMHMKPEIRERLLKIAEDFYSTSGFTAPIQDIILTGSMANYNYHDKSDLDVHVLIDFAKQNEDTEFAKNAANAIKWKWNEQHNISIGGHEVELYIQDANEPHVASGVYSLTLDKWLTEPSFRTINTSETDVQTKADAFVRQTTDLEERIDNATDEELPELLDAVDELRYKALRLRKDAFEEGEDEFSVGNLAFKELRNNGTIGKLLDLETKLYDRMQSVEASND